MPGVEELPTERLTYAQAAEMLGVHEITVLRMVRRGDLSTKAKWAKTGLFRADVEQLSLQRWRPGKHTWLTTTQVGRQLGVSRSRIFQLSNAGMLPFRLNPQGRRLFRPGQIAVIARARKVRLQRGN